MWEVDLNQPELRICVLLKIMFNLSNGTQVQSSPLRFRKHILPAIGFEGCICYIHQCNVGFPEILINDLSNEKNCVFCGYWGVPSI